MPSFDGSGRDDAENLTVDSEGYVIVTDMRFMAYGKTCPELAGEIRRGHNVFTGLPPDFWVKVTVVRRGDPAHAEPKVRVVDSHRVIKKGDVLELTLFNIFARHEELVISRAVGDDGLIEVPMCGKVVAAELAIDELQRNIYDTALTKNSIVKATIRILEPKENTDRPAFP